MFSDLMGMFDKRRFKKLLHFALNFDTRNSRTHQDVDPNETTTRELFSRFDLGQDVIEFTGHAIALHSSERWVKGYRKVTDKSSLRIWPFSLPSTLVTWTSPVWKPWTGSGCTPSLCPATSPVHTCTPCMGSGNYRRDLPGEIPRR